MSEDSSTANRDANSNTADQRQLHRRTVTAQPADFVVALVELVAEATGRPPTTLQPVYDVVDPEALAGLVGAAGDLETQFTYEGCQVLLSGAGDLVVEAPA